MTPLVSSFTAVSQYPLISITGGRPSRLNVHIGTGSSYSDIQARIHTNNSRGVTSTPADFETTFGDEVDLSSLTDTTLSLSDDEQHPQAGLSDANSSSQASEEGNNPGSSGAPPSSPTATLVDVAPLPIIAPLPAPVVAPPPVVAPAIPPAPVVASTSAPAPINPNAINSTPDGPEDGDWYAITVGRRVGVFNDWCVARIPESAGWLTFFIG